MSSRSLNRVIIIGNLTRDPELKYTPSGTAVCTFGVATNRSWTTTDGQTKEDVQYHRIVAWQKLAELCAKLLNKGRKVYLEGRLTYRTFVGRDGVERTVTEIVLDDFIVFSNGKRLSPSEEIKEDKQEEAEEKKQPEEKTEEKTEKEPEEKTEKQTEDENEEKSEEKTAEEEKEEDINPDDIPF